MSNKPLDSLNELDRALRLACPVDMSSGVKVTISLMNGFELFNTRPYHNYETWSDGYRAEGFGVVYESEDLDDCIKGWIAKVERNK